MIRRDYAASGFVALRSPYLPFDVLERWSDGFEAARWLEDPAAWDRDVRVGRARLDDILRAPAVREALLLASPSLLERSEAWRADPDGAAAGGIEAGLVKYVQRMAARCTPFGLFAGNTAGKIGRETRLELREPEAAVRHTRLDMELLDAIAGRLARDPLLCGAITFTTNTSLWEAPDSIRYAEARLVDGKRAYFLLAAESHDVLRRALARARNGASLREIAEAITDEEIPFEAALDFAGRLADAQMLLPDLGPVVTGPDSLEALVSRLEGIPGAEAAKRILGEARDALSELDRTGCGAAPSRYRDLAAALAPLADVDPNRLVQVDLVKPAVDVVVSEQVVDELLRGVQVLLDLFGRGRRDPLADFRRAFEERYGDREVPLLEALDEELGVGFQTSHGPSVDPSPLLTGLPFPPEEEEERMTWGARARFLEWKLAEAVAGGAEEIVLLPDEVARFRDEDGPRLANAFHVIGSVLAADPRDRSAPLAILDSAAGPSGARLLGRFCHGDARLREGVEAHLRAEEALRPDVLYFEVVHLPEGRTGNILARPLLRSHELAFLGRSGASRERTLVADDLTVRLEGGRVLLRSRSLDREVRPRLTSAHNTAWRSLGVYRFLSALQSEGFVEGIAWTWGPLESQPRLPRVRFGRVVLARAQWNARREEVEAFRAANGHSAFRAVQEFRARRGLPRWVGLVEADNVLPVDLDHPLSVAALRDALRGKEGAVLQELFPGARTDAVRSSAGAFLNEIVVPVVRRVERPAEVPPAASPPGTSRASGSRETREGVFAPGSEWLSVKLYAGPAVVDRLLTEIVAPLVPEALGSGAARTWFFLRFGDPEWHVRLRFEGEPARLLAEVLPALHGLVAPLVSDRSVHRVQIDTYVREIPRYGGSAAMLACEEIFQRDSETALAVMARTAGDEGLDARWRFVLAGMDALLDDFGFDVAGKHALCKDLARTFATEFRSDAALKRRMMDRYRAERKGLEALLGGRGGGIPGLPDAGRLLATRSAAIAAPCDAIARLESEGRLSVERSTIAASLLHLHANRILRSAPRAQEMVLYHFLESAYDSQRARARAAGGASR